MFSKPKHGWTDIKIGDFTGCGSYLTDIPLDFLLSAVNAAENNIPFAMFIDEEGTDLYITAYHYGVVINRFADEVETYHYFDIEFRDFLLEGVNDIVANLDDWLWFKCGVNVGYNEEDIEDDGRYLGNKREVFIDYISRITGVFETK
jgi:hypothetical protein